MKAKTIISAIAVAIAPTAMAQSAIDALQITQPDFRGTSRFMSMGGAFTALGGDLSTLTQNPAGIGIYRSSEIGVTLDIGFNKTTTNGSSLSDSKTKAACNNFGYVGVANLGSALRTFSWGVTYNRVAQFDRRTRAYAPSTSTSLTDYIASYTTTAGYSPSQLNFGQDYNPYINSECDWLSILAYNSYLINENPNGNGYVGLFNNKTVGDADLDVRERGSVDEYSINFGGNIEDIVFWGLGVGITDLNYDRQVTYSESMANATIYSNAHQGLVSNGNAGFYLDNWKHINATGWKLSFGLIVKPINELRIGAAIHSPTYWSARTTYEGAVDYSFTDVGSSLSNATNSGNENTDYADYNWKLNSPWRFMVGVAGVIGTKAIVSLDYERVAYNDMKVKSASNDYYGYGYEDNPYVTEDIHNYTRAGNIVRLGIEYRVTPKFSVRAGYNYQTSYISDSAKDGATEVITSGTDPSYSLNKDAQAICLGLGYKFGAFYVDGAYVHSNQKSSLHAYTDYNGNKAPKFDVTQNNNSVVLSVGYRF